MQEFEGFKATHFTEQACKELANLRQIQSLNVQIATNQSQRAAYAQHLKYLQDFSTSTDQRIATFNYLADQGIVPRIKVNG